jgi:hypothetical protein
MNQDLYNAVIEYRKIMYDKAVSVLNEGKRFNPVFYIITIADQPEDVGLIDIGLIDGIPLLQMFGSFNMSAVTYVHGICYDMMKNGKQIIGVGFMGQNTVVWGHSERGIMDHYDAIVSLICLREGVEHDIFKIEKNETGHYLKDLIDDKMMMRDTMTGTDPLRKLFPHDFKRIRIFIVDYSVYAPDYMTSDITADFGDYVKELHDEIERKRAAGFKTVLMKFPDHAKPVENVRLDLYDKKLSFSTMPDNQSDLYKRLMDQCVKVWQWDVDENWIVKGMISEFHSYLSIGE